MYHRMPGVCRRRVCKGRFPSTPGVLFSHCVCTFQTWHTSLKLSFCYNMSVTKNCFFLLLFFWHMFSWLWHGCYVDYNRRSVDCNADVLWTITQTFCWLYQRRSVDCDRHSVDHNRRSVGYNTEIAISCVYFRSGKSFFPPTMQRAWHEKLETDWTPRDNSPG